MPRAPARDVLARAARPVRRAAFVSDLHLDGARPAGVARAAAWLDDPAVRACDAVFLLGDIFAAWMGRPSLHDPGLAPVLARLGALTDRGVRVALVHGNHDFLAGDELTDALGVEVAADGLWVALGGQRAWLTHGDAFCTRDVGYHRLHAVLRCRPMRWWLGRLSRPSLASLASLVGAGAGRATASKPLEVMSIVDGAVEHVLRRGADVVVCGHVHRARDAELQHGRLVVMADFETTGSHARYADGRLELVPADPRFAPPPAHVVAIDGPAGSGKSSVARQLAGRLGWLRLDSGALYRAVALAALDAGIAPGDGPALGRLMAQLDVALDREGSVRLDGRPVPDEQLRSPDVSAIVSPVSAVPAVREALLPVQRRALQGREGLVAEGRDMASVVFPDALLSVYLDARPEVRARRRLEQNPGEGRTLEEVLEAQAERDRRDSSRAQAPLTRAEGAWLLDTSDLDQGQVVERLAAEVAGRLARAREAGTQVEGGKADRRGAGA